ncbi:hypothetical protein M427DRAFT_35802 [Gonapodya prolifera JEL478]|uniref:Uncharacterized protein n=1 Tax=Gonapodya prolifera (strain JEL478) TaxID=1344416 RepID=A0A139A3P9_GONPJ|nr:hypothetical protein M427DRAFT_35802 [Gonapodya prolifera JEL478]|eukprot:KXS11422.1 hypothetical protein M427DRAFT_35802 [Gonapodya prolifera JEL478]
MDFEIQSAIASFVSKKFPFPNANRLTTPYGEVHVTPSNNIRVLHLSPAADVLDILLPSFTPSTPWSTSQISSTNLFALFSASLPPATQRLIVTVRTPVDPPQEDAGRKLWGAMEEISKRVQVMEVRIEASAGVNLDWVDDVRVCWKEQLDELVAAEVLKSGAVILRLEQASGWRF